MAKNQAEFDQLLQDLQQNQPNLKVRNGELDLAKLGLNQTDVIKLAKALKQNTTVNNLNLTDNNIGNAGAITLSGMLANNTTLTHLNLNYNNIGNEGTIALADMLANNTTVTKLNLKSNNIGPEGAEALAKTLENKAGKKTEKLTELDIAQNKIGAQGTMAIAKAFLLSEKIEFLSFCDNNICANGAHPSMEGVKGIEDLLIRNKSLKTLELGGNNINAVSIAPIAKALGANCSLKELDISYNKNLGPEGLKEIAKKLTPNESSALENLYCYSTCTNDQQTEHNTVIKKLVSKVPLLKLNGFMPQSVKDDPEVHKAIKFKKFVEKDLPIRTKITDIDDNSRKLALLNERKKRKGLNRPDLTKFIETKQALTKVETKRKDSNTSLRNSKTAELPSKRMSRRSGF